MQLTSQFRFRLRKREKGATAILVALSMVVLLGVAAISVDYATASKQDRALQNAADAAAIAVANACANGVTAQCSASYAKDYVQYGAGSGLSVTVTPSTLTSASGQVTVKVTGTSKSPLAGAAFGNKTVGTAASSRATWNGTVTSYIPDYPIAMDYCYWKKTGNNGLENTYSFGTIPAPTVAKHAGCNDPEDNSADVQGPYGDKAVIMTGTIWSWDSSKCKLTENIPVWKVYLSYFANAVFSTNAACKTKFLTLKPGQTILVPLFASTANKMSSTVEVSTGVKIVGFVPFKISTGSPFYDSGFAGIGAKWKTTCELDAVSSVLIFNFGCTRIKGSFVTTSVPFPDASYGTVTGYDPVKAALSVKLAG